MINLIKGDCLEIMKSIPDGSIGMILSDLPYGTTACKWDTIIPFETLWEQYNRIIKDNGAGDTVLEVGGNRNFIGIELNEDYYNIAKKRIEEYLK